MRIETGDILLVNRDGFLPDTIEDFQSIQEKEGAEFHHAGNMYCPNTSIQSVFEAEMMKCEFTSFKKYIESDAQLMILKPKKKLRQLEKEMIEKIIWDELLDLPYDYSNLFIHQVVKLLSLIIQKEPKWIGKDKNNAAKRFACGELVAYIYWRVRDYFENWNMAAPIDLYMSHHFDKYLYNKKTKELIKV